MWLGTPVWEPLPVDVEPEIIISDWRVLRANGGDYIVGWDMVNKNGRRSTPVKQFDSDRKIAVTRSGRTYRLEGQPGYEANADFVWVYWLKTHRLTDDDVEDVSHEYARRRESS